MRRRESPYPATAAAQRWQRVRRKLPHFGHCREPTARPLEGGEPTFRCVARTGSVSSRWRSTRTGQRYPNQDIGGNPEQNRSSAKHNLFHVAPRQSPIPLRQCSAYWFLVHEVSHHWYRERSRRSSHQPGKGRPDMCQQHHVVTLAAAGWPAPPGEIAALTNTRHRRWTANSASPRQR
jgi:hypothetical protein